MIWKFLYTFKLVIDFVGDFFGDVAGTYNINPIMFNI